MTKQAALITGASAGLGLEFACQLAASGWNLVLVARSADKLETLAQELRTAYNITAQIIALDLSRADATDTLMQAIKDTPVDLLINNAGFGDFGLFQDTDPTRTRQMIDLNVGTLTDLTRAILPQMITRKHGRILNVASVAAFQPGPLMAVYYATKAYVLSFSEALSNELQGTGITVTCLCPGPTKTSFEKNAHLGSSKLFKRGLMDAKTVVRIALDACMHGKALIIPGWKNRIGAFVTRFVPISTAAKVARFVQSPQ